MKDKTKKNRLNIMVSTWIPLAIGAILFGIVIARINFVPVKWRFVVVVGALLIAAIMLSLSLMRFRGKKIVVDGVVHRKKSKKKYVVSVLNVILAITFLVSSFFIHQTNSSLEALLRANNASNTKHYEIVALKSEYKEKHPEIFENTETSEDIKNYLDKKILVQTSSDQVNQEKAMDWANRQLETELDYVKKRSISETIAAFYNGEGEAMLISSSYKSALKNYEKYASFEDDTIVLMSIDIDAEVVIKAKAADTPPFSIYIGGNDEYGELLPEGRFDVNMMVTVNPKTRQVLIASFARDSYIPNIALGGGYDKLTHTGVLGVQNTIDSINNFYGTDANDYVIVNFSTFMSIIDTLGGITVNNPEAFTAYWSGNYYPAGEITLDATSALEYVRERYSLPDGDFGRNAHQQIVLKAIIEKLTSPATIPNFANILGALNGSFLTSIDISLINQLAAQTLDEGINWEIITTKIDGTEGMDYCASAPSELLSVVYPDASEVNQYMYQYNLLMSGQPIPTENTSTITKTADDGSIGSIKINVDALNIRSLPSTNGSIVGSVSSGQIYKVTETRQAEGYTWYSIGDGRWVADQNGSFLTYTAN